MASHWIRTHAFAKHFSICLKRGDRSCSFSIYVVWNLTSLLFNFRKSFYLAQRGDGPHTCRLPLVWQPTSLTTEPLWLGFDYHNRHYIWYIWLVALITKVFLAWLKTCSGGTGTHACRLPLVWQPTPLTTDPLSLGFKYHISHYILYVSNIYGNYWNRFGNPDSFSEPTLHKVMSVINQTSQRDVTQSHTKEFVFLKNLFARHMFHMGGEFWKWKIQKIGPQKSFCTQTRFSKVIIL